MANELTLVVVIISTIVISVIIVGGLSVLTKEKVESEKKARKEAMERKERKAYLERHPLVCEEETCSVIGKKCPYYNWTCAMCSIASSSMVSISNECEIPDRCTHCGANFTEDMIKDGRIVCEYCGKVHIIE